MSRAASPFRAGTLLAVLAVGAAAFLLLLYALGAGWDDPNDSNGGAHAASNGLTGYAGLVRLLEAQGHQVSLSRSAARFDEESLLVITPEHDADGAALWTMLSERRYVGPTLLILPKWFAWPAGAQPSAKPGWVMLLGAEPPMWTEDLGGLNTLAPHIVESPGWQGLGLSGALPVSETVQAASAGLVPLVTDDSGRTLAGYLGDGNYPVLAESANVVPLDGGAQGAAGDTWPIVVVTEPDLMNNYGLADRERAQLAHAIIDAALEDYDLPIVFDLTVPGLGQSENLLTLAFRPPFLAATLCLVIAALVIAWRAFRRFGPPVAEAPALAMGKRQLASNGGALVARARRVHLLGPPYAALIAARLAEALGVREADPDAREAAIARVLADRGIASDYPERAAALRRARHPAELLRAAGALTSIERTVTP